MRKDLWSLVSLARDKWFSRCFRTHVGKLALGMAVCIRFRILPFAFGRVERYNSFGRRGGVSYPRSNIGIPFTTICYCVCRTSLFRYCCCRWSCVPALTLRTVCLSKWLWVPCILKQGQSALALKGFDVLPKMILNFESKVNRLLWKYWNWVDMVFGTWLLIRFYGQ